MSDRAVYGTFPDDWTCTSLDAIASAVTSGGTPRSGDPRYYDPHSGYPFAKIEDLTRSDGHQLEDAELRVTAAALRESAAKLYPVGTILLSMYGTIGLAKQCAAEMAGNQALSALLPPFQCDPQYLLHHLDYVRDHWLRYSGQTTQANINGRAVKTHLVPLPPGREQRQIAHILDTLDTQIRRTEELIGKLEQIKQGLLTDLLTRGIDENGQLRPPPDQAPHLYKDSPLGFVPERWRVVPLEELATSSVIGPFGSDLVADDYRAEGVPVVFVRDAKVSGFQWNSDVYITPQKAIALKAHEVRHGDVILTKMGLPPCVACVYPNWMPRGVVTADIIRIRVDAERAQPQWVAEQANAEQVRRQVAAITGGVTRPKVTLRDVRNLVLALPDVEEQNRILVVVGQSNARLGAERRQLQGLLNLKAGLMNDLLTGRVRVTPLLDKAEQAAS
ncbi:restriction endonuclease subunit S [Alkalilimnicola sp. S0819]|uniref:restriction endonuclease subunit S n=1 Tax=Alkalilimnicola sp. S0819 TaxID=2613922 RepID=UPI0012616BB4|nr:restriction endonuclease subunit S [Alkalilimnicola sp. S0819]KAB7627603.1 hypothetical protein F3N43_03870 [Alkalilimnicola sp. S0819]MPQ15765.1 hypothetical protein [Alkalilimnicola sp. S0819]